MVARRDGTAAAVGGQCCAAAPWGERWDFRSGRAINESVAYALDHREAAVNYAMQFARDMDQDLADKFIGMYVQQMDAGLR